MATPLNDDELYRLAASIWGKRGARARAAALTAKERSAFARRAANRRWAAWRKAGKPPLPKRKTWKGVPRT
jgi:hypothetical protein